MEKLAIFLAAAITFTACSAASDDTLSQTGEDYKTEKCLDYFLEGDLPWDETVEITLPEYPDMSFNWTSENVTANDGSGETPLYWGMPVYSVYLCDLTGDGKRELCFTVAYGSGIVDYHIIVYDIAENREYTLWDRGEYDYSLTMEGDKLTAVKSEYLNFRKEAMRGELTLVSPENTETEGHLSIMQYTDTLIF